jgi:maltooligosyltrehalose trehalohydrolase
MDALRPHPPGVVPIGGGRWHASIWAPEHREVWLHLVQPDDRLVPLARGADGVHAGEVGGLAAGARYWFRLGEREVADPASRLQPLGVHGPSELFDPARDWNDGDFRPPPLAEMIIYELHVGTFSQEGTFAGVARQLDDLVALGVNAVELMPIAEFPGARNWGYDGVFPWAVQSTYGGPRGLADLVEACHRRGLAVLIDVVYNHLGPEGQVHGQVAPYFREGVRTAWGEAPDFDQPEVRRHFIESARYLARDLHVDGFRVDAIHAIQDATDPPFLRELCSQLHALERPLVLIAESDLNQAHVVMPPEQGGLGFDAQWSDDFHHAAHALLTGERRGYYADYGEPSHLARAIANGWVYAGDHSAVRGRPHGSATAGVPGESFVVCVQNHDQIGNRAWGERLGALVGADEERLAAVLLSTAPFVPLLFMGQEDGDEAPFLYFTSHSDEELIAGIRRGRAAEFASFGWDPAALPDPQDEVTFARSRPRRQPGPLRELYRALFRLRREHPALCRPDRERTAVDLVQGEILVVDRWSERGEHVLVAASFARAPAAVDLPQGREWQIALDTAGERTGPAAGRLELAPRSAVIALSSAPR